MAKDNSKTSGKTKKDRSPTTKAPEVEIEEVEEETETEAVEDTGSGANPHLSNLISPVSVNFVATAQVDDCVVTLRPFIEDDAEYFEIDHAAAVKQAMGRTLINIGDDEGETDYMLADFESFMLSLYALADATGTPVPTNPNN